MTVRWKFCGLHRLMVSGGGTSVGLGVVASLIPRHCEPKPLPFR